MIRLYSNDLRPGEYSGEMGAIEHLVGSFETARILLALAVIAAGWVYGVGALCGFWRWWA